MDVGVAEIDKWHRARGFSQIGYHYVIRRNGIVETGRDIDNDGDIDEEVGAHAAGHNSHSLGICMVGGIDEQGNADSNFTLKQWLALDSLLRQLLARYDAKVIGHRDVDSGKECPSFDASCLL